MLMRHESSNCIATDMPVQPQYAFGHLGQPASPNSNQIPAQLDGSARYFRTTPPRMFGPESSTIACHQLSEGTSQISPVNTNSSLPHRDPVVPNSRMPENYSFLDPDDTFQFVRRNGMIIPQTNINASLIVDPSEHLSNYPPLRNVHHQSVDLSNGNSHMKNEFHVVNEDFPALPGVDESANEAPSSQPLEEPTDSEPVLTIDRLEPDNYDLKSLMDRLSSEEFCKAYRVLNLEDLPRRNALLHPTAMCAMETMTRDVDVANLQIGVNIFNGCTALREPEDLRNEDPYHRLVFGHRIPLPEYDKSYAISDDKKDKLRNPRLHTMDDLTLFFQFYFFTRDTAQLIAADALFQRNWRFNKKISRWCRFQRVQPSLNVQVGVFQIYDPISCKIQTANLQYSSQDFELFPPVIPFPSLRNVDIDYVEKL